MNQKAEGRYSTVGLPESEFEAGSHNRVLKNLLGIKKTKDMDLAETDA